MISILVFSVVIAIVIIVYLYILRKNQKSKLFSLPSDINIDNIETYIFKSIRLKKIVLSRFTDTLFLIPKFTSTYYNSVYNNICDLKENAVASMYLTTIGNINLSSKILHSMIYLMIDSGWDPFAAGADRLVNYKGINNIYNITINDSAVSLPQKNSDVSTIYISMALMKFLLTYDRALSSNTRYRQFKKLYSTAAYDLWKYIVDNHLCTGGTAFHSYKNILGTLSSTFTTNLHIAMYACCNYLDIVVENYGIVVDSKLSISRVREVCSNFIDGANKENGTIIYEFTDCKLSYDEKNLSIMNKGSEDYLNLLLLDYPIERESLIENLFVYFSVPDTDSLPTGCGPGVYNAECENRDTDVSTCYNISCNPKHVPSDRVMYGIKWSAKGAGLTFSMSALSILALAMNNNFDSRTLNLKNSLIKIYREYQGLYIIGGFQDELAFTENPYNTGTGESVFRYPSLLAVVLSGFLFLYMNTEDKSVNYILPNTKNFDISNSILDFDDSPLFVLL